MSNIDPEYIPQFCMPIIEPPTQGDPSTYYQNLELNATATQLSDNTNGIKYVATRDNGDTGLFDHYLLMDSLIHFVKAGSNFPGWGSLAGTTCSKNTLLIKPNPVANEYLIKKLPSGIPPPIIMIENVEESSFTQDLTAYIHKALNNNYWPYIHSMMTILLDDTWSEINGSDPAQASLNDKINLFINQVINSGDYWFFLKGSSKLGKILNNASNEAEFNIKMLDTSMLDYITPVAFLRQMITLPDRSAGTKWTDHPLISSIESFSTPVDIYLKFEIWNPLSVTDSNEPHYVPVDANCEVRVQQYIENSNDIIGDTAYTNADGEVLFHYNSLPDADFSSETPNIYFEIINPVCSKIDQFNIDADRPIILPDNWSTKPNENNTDNWFSVDGSPGYYDTFQGIKLGSSSYPLTYRIGVDYHLKMTYQNSMFPKGLAVCLIDKTINEKLNSEYKQLKYIGEDRYFGDELDKIKNSTDKSGVIHGISFDFKPGTDLGFLVYFEMHDLEVDMNKCRINFHEHAMAFRLYHWSSFTNDQDNKIFNANQKTTIGTPNSLYRVDIAEKNRTDALYVAKTMYEVAYFFNYFTNATWKGFNDLKININTAPGTSSAIPIKNVYIDEDYTDDRSVIVHELCHQVLYSEIWGTGLDLVLQSMLVTGGPHNDNYVINRRFSFFEGWSIAIAKIFCMTFESKESFLLDLIHISLTEAGYKVDKLTPMPLNTGERVEGAYANIISLIFWNYVCDGYVTSLNTKQGKLKRPSGYSNNDIKLNESDNGDLSQKNYWLNNNNKNDLSTKFLSFIFTPFTSLDISNSLTYAHLKNIIDNFSGIDKLRLRADYYRWNSFIVTPKIKVLSPQNLILKEKTHEEVTISCDHLVLPDNYDFQKYGMTDKSLFKDFRDQLKTGIEMKIVFFNSIFLSFASVDIELISETKLKVITPELSSGNYIMKLIITIRKDASLSSGYELESNGIEFNVQ